MKVVKVKDVNIGEGKPKICVPVIGDSISAITQNAKAAGGSVADLVEWRCDYFENIFDNKNALEALKVVTNNINGKPLLCTFRSSNEGGEQAIASEKYIELYEIFMKTGLIDMVDVELFAGDDVVGKIISIAKENNVKVIISNHDFDKTPEDMEIMNRLIKMQSLGGDIAKIAVMPQCKSDVIRLMSVTRHTKDECMNIPVITMSMAAQGKISRMSGEIFGSDVTFGAVTDVSAPGQINIDILSQILDTIHDGMEN